MKQLLCRRGMLFQADGAVGWLWHSSAIMVDVYGAGVALGDVFDVIAHVQHNLVRQEFLGDEVQYHLVGHLPDDEPCLLIRVGAVKHLAAADARGGRTIRFNGFHRAGLIAPGVVNQELGIDAKDLVELFLSLCIQGTASDIAHGIKAHVGKLFGIALAHAPKIRYRGMCP